jgi:hypothetical protein
MNMRMQQERRGPERRMENVAGVALLNQVRRHGAARVVLSTRGTTLEPDLMPHMVTALRELHALVAAADQPFGPSKADSIAAMRQLFEVLPADIRALVVPE